MILTIKIVRIARGLSLVMLRDLSGVNETDISRIERGRLLPTDTQLHKLAAALNLPAEELLKPFVLDAALASSSRELAEVRR